MKNSNGVRLIQRVVVGFAAIMAVGISPAQALTEDQFMTDRYFYYDFASLNSMVLSSKFSASSILEVDGSALTRDSASLEDYLVRRDATVAHINSIGCYPTAASAVAAGHEDYTHRLNLSGTASSGVTEVAALNICDTSDLPVKLMIMAQSKKSGLEMYLLQPDGTRINANPGFKSGNNYVYQWTGAVRGYSAQAGVTKLIIKAPASAGVRIQLTVLGSN